MTTATHPLASFVADLEAAFEETARGALGVESVEVTSRGEQAPPSWQGAYLGLVGPAGALQIGIAGEENLCQAMAKSLLGLDPKDEKLPTAEMADAVCEVVNILAGAFKGKVRDRVPALTMGLPTFFNGAVQETERTAVKVSKIRFGGLDAAIMFIHPRGAPEA